MALENARLTETLHAERERRSWAVAAQGSTQATPGHELRSPLNAIQSYSSLLLDGIFGPLTDRQRESIARIRKGGQHLLALIENMLNVARLTAEPYGSSSPKCASPTW